MEKETAHEKSCLCCVHLEIDFGMYGYSEFTPGSPGSVNCKRAHFKYADAEACAEQLETAKRCKDFKHR